MRIARFGSLLRVAAADGVCVIGIDGVFVRATHSQASRATLIKGTKSADASTVQVLIQCA